MTVRDARADYFAANGFSEAAYSDRWVTLKLGPIPLVMWSSPGRRRAIVLHDLHHVATGYATTWAGEAEIGAWEIAAGCADYAAAWFYNASAFAFGVVVHPRRTFRAFVRGRRSRSLYAHGGYRPELLELEVEELRRERSIDLSRPRPGAMVSRMSSRFRARSSEPGCR
ncbi:MAG TPA: hypothetical protein VGL61_04555 [Kofleriaceae bacterium]|jgi:hypothetical protein